MTTRNATKHSRSFCYCDIPIDQDLQVAVLAHYY